MKVLLSILMAIAVSSPLALASSTGKTNVRNPQTVRAQYKGHNSSGTSVCRNATKLGRTDLSLPKKENKKIADALNINDDTVR